MSLMSVDEKNDRQNADGWLAKLRYSHSFLAKLAISAPNVKEYYAAIANKLLSYDKVSSRVNWSGVNFRAGRVRVAVLSFSGKTLCLYLPLDPEKYGQGRYKIIDVSAKVSYAAIPAKLKIKSNGALKFALSLIDKLATDRAFSEKSPLPPPILAKNFPEDTFENLLSRGLIKFVGKKKPTQDEREEQEEIAATVSSEVAPEPQNQEEKEPETAEKPQTKEKSEETEETEIYKDTIGTNRDLISRYEEYGKIIDALRGGNLTVTLRKKFMLDMIDETWIKAIEDALPALDEVVRTPSHFIEETEKILPIERTKKVSDRSIRHLSQHTDLISRIEKNNTVIPSKLLNVFREDSIMTYENKFVNTLLNRLFFFVTTRYDAALKKGANRKITSLEFFDKVNFGKSDAKIRLEIELSDPLDQNLADSSENQNDGAEGENISENGAVQTRKKTVVRNYALDTDLWKRVKKLCGVVKNYQSSEFVMNMGKAFIRPPVMHTNPILKNKNLRECLSLWEFIESYEDKTGVIADKSEENISEELLEHIYNGVAEQYLVFCKNLSAEAEKARNSEYYPLENDLRNEVPAPPEYVFEKIERKEWEKDVNNADEVAFFTEVAISADEIVMKERAEQERIEEERRLLLLKQEQEKAAAEEERRRAEQAEKEKQAALNDATPDETGEPEESDDTEEQAEIVLDKDDKVVKTVVRYRKSFTAKLYLAGDDLKEYYCAIYNKFLSKKKVSARSSFSGTTFNFGRKKLAKAVVIGKSLRLYLALDPTAIPPKFFAKNVSDVKKYANLPTMVKIKSHRALIRALMLIDEVCADLEQRKGEPPFITVSDFPALTIDKLVAMGLAFKTLQTVVVFKNKEKQDSGNTFFRSVLLSLKKVGSDEEVSDANELSEILEMPDAVAETLSDEEKKVLLDDLKRKVVALKNTPKTTDEKPATEETEEQTDGENVSETENNEVTDANANEQQAINPETDAGGGDPLLVKKEVMDSITNVVLDLPQEETAETTEQQTPTETVSTDETPVGGDALLLKPITLEELTNAEQAADSAATTVTDEDTPAEDKETEKKRGFFSRLFRRK